ncbi:ABC multidrug transporter mdr1 [Penicillium chermesinum]|uniref:ABC multidrug transporter mdr1 n=1 Tax=Penicillium chermesinum TaxID=63820 RepID=A0A9W9TYQ2_9EURO|nr:ABC multidrug transporter mdr1 [Penicillium chermesinum]KAJ5247718.1 ABC multidrug transporter mdr1 [Penicillium chermesinum]
MSQPAGVAVEGKSKEAIATTSEASRSPRHAQPGADELIIQKANENKTASPEEQEDLLFSHLPEHEQAILQQQVKSPRVNISFFSLYRYASKLELAILTISTLCAIAAGAAMPLFTILFGSLTTAFQKIELRTITYDHFMKELDKNVLYFVWLGIGEFITVYISTVGFTYTGGRVTQKIREHYLQAILRQNIGYFDKLGAGEVTTRITADTNLIQDGVSQKVGLTLTAVATFVTAFIVAYSKYARLAGICTSTIVALVLLMGIGSTFIVKYSQQSLESYAAGDTVAEEVLSSIRVATAFGTQERLASQYDEHLHIAEKAGFRLQLCMAIIMGPMFGIMFWNYGFGFWMGSRYLVQGEVNVGQVLTVLMSILIGSFAIGNVSPNGQAFVQAVAAATKIFSTIDRIPPVDATLRTEGIIPEFIEGNIELRNIKHIYPSRPDVTVMKDLSLFIPAGKTTALVGPSGSSKSTIMDLIERFYLPVGGSIYLDGVDMSTINLRWLRQQISLVSQEPVLFGTTIFNNIRHGLTGTKYEHESEDTVRQLVESAAKTANAHVFINALPEGYDTNVGQRGFLLSGGQKQRIAIARAIVSDPKILLLDEATSALDTKSEGLVQAALDNASAGRTTITIAHRLSTIKTAQNIVVLVSGSIVEQGTHDELIRNDGPYSKLVEAQRFKEDIVTDVLDHDGDELSITFSDISDEDGKELGRGNSIDSPSLAEDAIPLKEMNRIQSVRHSIRKMDTRKSVHSMFLAPAPKDVEQKYSLWSLITFIASFNKEEWIWMVVGLVFSCLAGGGQPTQAYLYSKALSVLSLPKPLYHKLRTEANYWSLVFFAIGIAQFITFIVHGACFGVCSERLVRKARSMAFRRILRQDISYFDKEENSTGALTSFLSTETKSLAGISGQNLGMILMTLTTLIGSMCIALAFGWKLALVCISLLPVLLGCGFFQFYMLAKFESDSKEGHKDSASFACEAASSIRIVASLTREEEVWNSYHEILESQNHAHLISNLRASLLFAASQALVFFCVALGFWYGGGLLGRHEYDMLSFFVAFSEILFGAQSAGAVFSFAPDMGKAKNAAFELRRLFDSRPKIDPWSSQDQPVLRGIDLTIHPGQYIALVGPSGCGKSTTIALLERFYDATRGGIYIDGKNITDLNVNSYRSLLALVSQEPTLYQGTIKENILMGVHGGEASDEEIKKVCYDANIHDFIMSLPDGFETKIGNKGLMLSGGQKQRVAIARALLRNPRILLLDEATSALDSQSEKVVQAALDAAARGRTTIAIAHRLSTIQKADVIYVFDQGKIVESGTHQELLRLKGHYYELVNLQSLGKGQ